MFRTSAVGALLAMLAVASGTAAQHTQPYNLVIIVLDSSISFQVPSKEPGTEGRVPVTEALGVVQGLFNKTGEERRRRNVRDDRYIIVAADAAAQVIWRGDRAQLGRFTPEALLDILKVRRQFAYCTDYEAAFNAAASVMLQHADASDIYVLTFGDLVHEPPTSSYRTCASPTGEPPPGIDWETLTHAALGFYFVSTDFKLRPNKLWSERLDALGATAEFRDSAQTLTQPLELPPPSQAVYRPTEEQVKEAHDRMSKLKAVGWTAAKWAIGGFGFLGASLFALIFIRRGKSNNAGRIPAGGRRG
jgi:hypothetical protein